MSVPRIYLPQEPAGLSGECAERLCTQGVISGRWLPYPSPRHFRLRGSWRRTLAAPHVTRHKHRRRDGHGAVISSTTVSWQLGKQTAAAPAPTGRLTGGFWVVCSRGSCRVGLISDPLLAVSETNKWLSKILKKSHDEIKGNRSPSEKC